MNWLCICIELFFIYLFFNTLFTTLMEDTSLLVEVNTSTFHTWDERPLCTMVATARTVSPSCAEDIWFPLAGTVVYGHGCFYAIFRGVSVLDT